MKKHLCRWKCGRLTESRSRICQFCLDERDERNRQIDAGARYIPPTERPGHRFFDRKQLSEPQKAAIERMNAARNARISRPKAGG